MPQSNSLQTTDGENLKGLIRKRKKPILSVQVKNKLVKVMAETGDERTACAALEVSRVSFRNALEKDHSFAERISMAKDQYLAELEREAKRRAIDGVEKDIYYQGDKVGTETKYSDKLLETLLHAADPDKYSKQTKVENTTSINVDADTGMRQKLAAALQLDIKDTPIPLEDEAIEGEYSEDD